MRLASLLLLALTLPGCKKAAPVPQRPPPPVTVTLATARDVPLYLDEIGTCTASEVVAVKPQATGLITEILFTDGQDLKRGDPLFTIDPRPYKASLDQAKAGLTQNQASLVLAVSEFERDKALLPAKAVSREDYETKQNAVEVDKAMIQASEAAIETARVNLSYCYIYSPIDGRAGVRQIDIGNAVTANSVQVLLTIQRLDPIYADFTITERDLARVRQEMARGTLKTLVSLPDGPDQSREGDLTFLDNAVQDNTGTIKVRATLANADRLFWPGQFVNVRLVLRTLKDAVLVPSQSTQISQNGQFVYVIGPDLRAELRLVKLGQRQGEMVVVCEGLRAGERVVVTGQLTVTPGEKVAIQTPTTQATQTAQTQGATRPGGEK